MRMVKVAAPRSMVAPTGELRVTTKVSSGSNSRSPLTVTLSSLVDSPRRNFRVPPLTET